MENVRFFSNLSVRVLDELRSPQSATHLVTLQIAAPTLDGLFELALPTLQEHGYEVHDIRFAAEHGLVAYVGSRS